MNNQFVSLTALKDILKNYYKVLQNVGYVKHDTMCKIMAYLFILDWLDDIASFVGEEDYDLIKKALRTLFVNGDCLFVYPVFSLVRTILGSADNEGLIYPRIDEEGTLRSSEDDILRIIE